MQCRGYVGMCTVENNLLPRVSMCRRQFLSVCRFIIMCNIGAEIHYGRVEATNEPT